MDVPLHWDAQADVVVVGYGGAGAAAAITAHDAGGSVLLLEKQAADTPTVTRHAPNVRMAAGAWLSPNDEEAAVVYLEALVGRSHETLDDERKAVVRTLAHHLAENDRWLKGLGVEWGQTASPDYPELPGSEAMTVHLPKANGPWWGGPAVFKVLSENVARRGIPVLWETRAKHLIASSGEVRGVLAESGGKRLSIQARRAVVLACGGFEFNEPMKQDYLRAYPAHFYGTRANTGDGILMALEVGASLWHMNAACWRAVIKTPEFAFSRGSTLGGEIFVDKAGGRFANEAYRTHAFGYDLVGYASGLLQYTRVPSYWVFDEKRMRAGPLVSSVGHGNPPGGVGGPEFYTWSKDNRRELENGWSIRADTLTDLATSISQDADNQQMMEASVLEKTVRDYNRSCRRGTDPEFRRPKETLVPVEDPPYYAVKLWPGGANTQGGPRRNARCQALRPDGMPVPRLYTAGDLGSFWGMLTDNGGGTGQAYASGRIAGGNGAMEERWD